MVISGAVLLYQIGIFSFDIRICILEWTNKSYNTHLHYPMDFNSRLFSTLNDNSILYNHNCYKYQQE